MGSMIYRRNDCRLCGSRRLDSVFLMNPSPIGDAYVTAGDLDTVQECYPIELFMCGSCGLAQLLDVVDPNVLYGHYLYVTSSSLGLASHFNDYARETIEAISPSPRSLVVDIGSNDGTLLRQFASMNMRVLGVEPARHIAEAAAASGIPTEVGFFTPAMVQKIVQEHGRAAIVTANNVVANIDDLNTLFSAVKELLEEDGVLVFESYYLADVVRNMVFDFIYHEHITSFSLRPLDRYFSTIGMRIIDVKRTDSKGGSVRYVVQNSGGRRSVRRSVAELHAEEEAMGLYERRLYAEYSQKVEGLKRQTIATLAELKARGDRIVGYGASITATTLIYNFEIGGFLEYLVDDNPAKQGRFSPGHHLPVHASGKLYDDMPDVAVILAWRYADPIVDRHRRYLDQGGRFLSPVPQVKFLSR